MELTETKDFNTGDGKLSAKTGFIEPGVLATLVLGNADEHSAAEYSGYVTHLFSTEGLKGMIVDAAEAGSVAPEAVLILARSDALNFVKKIGVYNVADRPFKVALEAIIKASGRDNIKIFQTMEEALAYVEGSDHLDSAAA